MQRNPIRRLLATLLPACLALVACGGGGDSGSTSTAYVAARSASFSPTTARDSATNAQAVALHWVYAVNDGRPITASAFGISVGITFTSMEVTLAPTDLRRLASMRGTLSASDGTTTATGEYSGSIGEDLVQSLGKTVFRNQSAEINLSVTGGGESASAKGVSSINAFTPAYEWFPDRESLDQLAIGHVETITSSGSANFNITITGEAPIVKSTQPVAVSDRWTVLEKLPTMVVRGKTYSNVVKLSRQTRVPDFAGNLTSVTIYYWVAKGVGMIRGQGTYRLLNLDDVVYELTDTNLSQV